MRLIPSSASLATDVAVILGARLPLSVINAFVDQRNDVASDAPQRLVDLPDNLRLSSSCMPICLCAPAH